MNKTQKGFAVLEGLLILVIVGLIAGTGWYVWSSSQQTDINLANAENSSEGSTITQKLTNSTKEDYSGWSTYTSKLENVSLKYPAEWEVVSDGKLFDILNGTSKEEVFTVQSSTERISGKDVYSQVTLNTATSGLSAGDCHGLVVDEVTPIKVSGRNLSIVALNSYTHSDSIIGVHVTDEKNLQKGSTTSICQPSFASIHGNSKIHVSASFAVPLPPHSQAAGQSIELTIDEYHQSINVAKALKSLRSLTY